MHSKRKWYVWSVLVVVVLCAWFVGDWVTDNMLRRVARTAVCQISGAACFEDVPVLIRTFVDAAEPVPIAGAKVFVAGAPANDSRFERRYRAILERKVSESGGSIAERTHDADLQLLLAYHDGSYASPSLPGWGRASKLVAIDISRIVQRGRSTDYVRLRQLHFHSFGSFISTDETFAFAVESVFTTLSSIPAAGFSRQIVTLGFSSNTKK